MFCKELFDTVGFISDLPTDLVAAFRATLEEVVEADIIVHVRDIASPETEAQKSDVLAVMDSLGVAEDTPGLEVLNKLDLMAEEAAAAILSQSSRHDEEVAISAATGTGCDLVLQLIDARLADDNELHEVVIPYDDGRMVAWLYENGDVQERRDEEDGIHFRVSLDAKNAGRLEQVKKR